MTTGAHELYKKPDGTIQSIAGHDFARTHPKTCPWCMNTFWTWMRVGALLQPYAVDQEPQPGDKVQARETCYHHLCLKAEWEHQARRFKPVMTTRNEAKS